MPTPADTEIFEIMHTINHLYRSQQFRSLAGSASYKAMTKAQVRRAEPIAQRIANGTASPADFALLAQGKQAVHGEGLQVALDLGDRGAGAA